MSKSFGPGASCFQAAWASGWEFSVEWEDYYYVYCVYLIILTHCSHSADFEVKGICRFLLATYKIRMNNESDCYSTKPLPRLGLQLVDQENPCKKYCKDLQTAHDLNRRYPISFALASFGIPSVLRWDHRGEREPGGTSEWWDRMWEIHTGTGWAPVGHVGVPLEWWDGSKGSTPERWQSWQDLADLVRRLGALVVEILIGRVAYFPRFGYGLVINCDHLLIATCTRCKCENYVSWQRFLWMALPQEMEPWFFQITSPPVDKQSFGIQQCASLVAGTSTHPGCGSWSLGPGPSELSHQKLSEGLQRTGTGRVVIIVQGVLPASFGHGIISVVIL